MTTIPRRHAWTLARLLGGEAVNGEADGLPPGLRLIANHLAAMEPQARLSDWPIIQATHPDGDALALALTRVDPAGLPPEEEAQSRSPATIEDLRKLMAETSWQWEPWIPSSRLFGVAGFEGTGKTRFALDLAARIYHGKHWPDGQPPTLPEGTRTLWLCSDGQHDELAETASSFGLPDDAVAFCAVMEEPYEGTSIDEPETLGLLDELHSSDVAVAELAIALLAGARVGDQTAPLVVADRLHAYSACLRQLADRHTQESTVRT